MSERRTLFSDAFPDPNEIINGDPHLQAWIDEIRIDTSPTAIEHHIRENPDRTANLLRVIFNAEPDRN